MSNNKLIAMLFLFSTFSTNTLAADIRPIGLIGAYLGGENLVETTASDLDAGGLLYFGGGILVEQQESNLSFQATLGYKFDYVDFYTSFGPGDATISSLPLELTAYIRNNNIRIGGGIAYHIDPEYEFCVDSLGCDHYNFDDALGLIAELSIDLQQLAFIGFRYTNIDYEIYGASIDASNFGVNIGVKF